MGSIGDPGTLKPVQLEFHHEELGTIIGWERGGDIIQFRGLPYASIPGRFRQSVLSETLPSQPFVATNPGPTCPHPEQPFFPYWKAPLADDNPIMNVPEPGELDCLNLTLTVPKASSVNRVRRIPVLVFIHGGAFVGGSHAIQLSGREVFDGASLVRHSAQIGKDIIVVGINYRVGPLGFLASEQLIRYGKSCGDKEMANYGLHDQRRALEWLSKFVAGFGGDPENITIQGTSAGSASCHYQSVFPDRKFKRAMLVSGSFFGFGPRPLSSHQQIFDNVSRVVTGDQLVSEEATLSLLLSCDAGKLTHGIPWELCFPLLDGVYITEKMLSGDLQGIDLPDTIVGSTSDEDQATFSFFLDHATSKPIPDPAFKKKVIEQCSANNLLPHSSGLPFACPSILRSYGLEETVKTPSRNVHGWNHLVGSLMFNIAGIYTALTIQHGAAERRVWLFEYAITNTYVNNHSYRKPHHGVNDLLLFDPAPDQIPYEDQDCWNQGVRQTQRLWVQFANGESPWQPLRCESRADTIAAIGPVYRFEDYGGSHVCETLQECIGTELTDQYQSVLEFSNLAQRP